MEQQTGALQAEIDARDAKMSALEKSHAETTNQMETMLGRLRELEGEKQQLEARVGLLQHENVELSDEVGECVVYLVVSMLMLQYTAAFETIYFHCVLSVKASCMLVFICVCYNTASSVLRF